jgi:hypothetical protein
MIRAGRVTVLSLVLAWAAAVQATRAAAPPPAQSALEFSVKASYLVRFAAFVEWPARAFATAQSPVTLCVTGRDPFGATLTQAAAAQTAYGRPLVVRHPATAAAAAGCHILYVGRGGDVVLSGLNSHPGMLVVTDAAVGPERGMIHFVVSDARVRFHIDQRAATASGLTISSRLLNLALTVQGA